MTKFSTGDLFDNRYKLLKELGGGQDAEVWTALDSYLDDEILVLKIFVRVGEGALERFFEDFKLLRPLSHPYIIKPFDVGKWDSQPYQKIEFIKDGSIFKRVEDEKPFSEQETAVFLSQIASALAYLHTNDIVHCDVKPENVLVRDNDDYVLTDFGISQKMKSIFARVTMGKDADTSKFGFSRAYAPPEISNKKQLNPSRDIFSLGVTLFELITCDLPFGDDGGRALLMGVSVPDLPEKYSVTLNQIVHQCLEKEADKRPTASDLASWAHYYLETGEWSLEKMPEYKQNIVLHPSNPFPSRPHSAATSVATVNQMSSNPPKPIITPTPKINYKPYLIGAGLVFLVLCWALWPKDQKTPIPEPQPLASDNIKVNNATKQNKPDKETIQASTSVQKNKLVKPIKQPTTENTNFAIKPIAKPIVTTTQEIKVNPNKARIEELLALGEQAISRENDKEEAINYFTQARLLNSDLNVAKVAKDRITRLYYIYEDKGDNIFNADIFINAKKWYEVAQALNNTAEIRKKIEICEAKMKN
jgi:serine/threonine protein kinase